MESEPKKVVYSVIALIVIGLLGWWLLSAGPSGSAIPKGESVKPVANQAPVELAPALQLTAKEKAGDVGEKRAQILTLVNSKTPLTPEEKADIGGIMLTKANVYKFTEVERQAIFAALSR